jgi:hypothetical protein
LGGCVEEGRKSFYGGGVAGVVIGVIDSPQRHRGHGEKEVWGVWEDGEVWEERNRVSYASFDKKTNIVAETGFLRAIAETRFPILGSQN